MNAKTMAAAALLATFLVFARSSPSEAGKGEKEAIDKLTSEVVVLERQIRDLQDSVARSNGQTVTLITQVSDSVSVATREIAKIQSALADTQVKVTGSLSNFDSRFLALDSGLRSVNERLGKTLDQVSSLRTAITSAQAQQHNIDPTDPVQLFSAAYGEYLKGNYQLAIDQFRQYVTRFPSLESADDAAYWMGDALNSLGKPQEALAELDALITNYPRGDRVAAARLKRGLILLLLNQNEAGVAELRRLIDSSPDSPEAVSAKERLEQMGVPLKAPRPAPAGPDRNRKRRTKP